MPCSESMCLTLNYSMRQTYRHFCKWHWRYLSGASVTTAMVISLQIAGRLQTDEDLTFRDLAGKTTLIIPAACLWCVTSGVLARRLLGWTIDLWWRRKEEGALAEVGGVEEDLGFVRKISREENDEMDECLDLLGGVEDSYDAPSSISTALPTPTEDPGWSLIQEDAARLQDESLRLQRLNDDALRNQRLLQGGQQDATASPVLREVKSIGKLSLATTQSGDMEEGNEEADEDDKIDSVRVDRSRRDTRGTSVDLACYSEAPVMVGSPRDKKGRNRSSSGMNRRNMPGLATQNREDQNLCSSRIQNQSKVNSLEDKLQELENGLGKLSSRVQEFVGTVRSPKGTPCGSSMLSCELARLKKDCNVLSRKLEQLAGDALESGCNRQTFSAMDVYESTNSLVERMADLLGACKQMDVEVTAPTSCHPIEWRIVMSHVYGGEEIALRRLAEHVKDCDIEAATQPSTLLRFLRARKGDWEEAASMFRASAVWRKNYQIEVQTSQWNTEFNDGETWLARLVKRYEVHRVIGKTKCGLPMMLFRWCAFDVVGAERELGTDIVLKIMLCIHEEICEKMREVLFERETVTNGCVIIWDIGNYKPHGVPNWWSRMWALARFLPKVAKILETNYPEVVRKIVIVRTGAAARTLYNAAVPFIPSGTLAKCKMFGWYAKEWIKELEDEVQDVKELPAFLIRDDDEAIASAAPVGGIYPRGAAAAEREAVKASDGTRRKGTRRRSGTPNSKSSPKRGRSPLQGNLLGEEA